MANLRTGKWFIERYDFQTGSRTWWVELTEEWTSFRGDATAYETVYLAQKAFDVEGFKKSERYNYHVQFVDDRKKWYNV